MLPNIILQIDHDLFNATKLKQIIIILNIHAPLLILRFKSPTAHKHLYLIMVCLGALPGESN